MAEIRLQEWKNLSQKNQMAQRFWSIIWNCPNSDLNKTTKGRFLRHPVRIMKVVMEPPTYQNRWYCGGIEKYEILNSNVLEKDGRTVYDGSHQESWEGRRGKGGAITIMWAQGSHANHHSDCWIVKFCQEESWYICVHHLFKSESESKRAACDMFGFNVSQAWIGVWQLGRRWRNWEYILHHHCMINDQVVQKLSTCWNMLALPCRLVNIRRHHHQRFCFKTR